MCTSGVKWGGKEGCKGMTALGKAKYNCGAVCTLPVSEVTS